MRTLATSHMFLLTTLMAFGAACGSSDNGGETTDAGTDGQAVDAGATDAGATDAGATDAGATDAGATDAGATDAGAQDAGAQDTAMDGAVADGGSGPVDAGPATADTAGACGTITAKGQCTGDKLQFCDEGKLVTDDCKKAMSELGTGTCMEVSAEWGSECALEAGGNCLSEDEEGNDVWEFCAGEKGACVDVPEGTLCKTDVLTCIAADVGTCVGELGIWECEAGMAYAIDCEAWEGKCAVVGEEPVCNNIAVDGSCDDIYLLCAEGLSCVGSTDEELGTCSKK